MIQAPFPADEAERIKNLKAYQILDSLPEKEYEDITFLASQICGTPIALISLIDTERQWFKSRRGIKATETGRAESFCSHAILQDEVLHIPDAKADERFHDNPFVTGELGLQFYAGAPLITPSGHKMGTICVIDHTFRTLSEDQVNALKALAHQVVSLLEARLKVIQLEKVQSALEQEKNLALVEAQARTEHLSNMSHEIRTPLNGIVGVIEILLDSNLEAEQKDRLNIIKRSSHALVGLTNDILDLAKLESGHMEMEAEPFDFLSTIRDVTSLFSVLSAKKNIGLNVEIVGYVPSLIVGDNNRYRQILTNLLSNAVKFTSEGQVSVQISATKTKLENEYEIQMSVTDTGPGISPEIQKKLFSTFTQADSSIARKFGGSGLGLAICRRIAERMNGKIELISEVGKGSTFQCTFIALQSSALSLEETSSSWSGVSVDRTRALKILVAEDNSTNQLIILSLLKKLGYVADVVTDGKMVLELLKQTKYDIIFMDYHMPELNGPETTVQIHRSFPEGRWPQVVALTASTNKEDLKRCRDAGMTGFLNKPHTLNELRKILADYSQTREKTANFPKIPA